jgi:hypothetical protein
LYAGWNKDMQSDGNARKTMWEVGRKLAIIHKFRIRHTIAYDERGARD